jgi:hypothetical protein
MRTLAEAFMDAATAGRNPYRREMTAWAELTGLKFAASTPFQHTVIWHFQGAPAGDYYNIGWPGYVGMISGMAPGRFSATLNQAFPLGIPNLQWPPSHLLRHVFECASDYDEAIAILEAAKVCFPAFIMLVGTKAGQAAIVELTTQGNRVHAMQQRKPIAIGNDYLTGSTMTPRCSLWYSPQAADVALS